MSIINLRDYYPIYKFDVLIDVPEDVANLLHRFDLEDAAAYLRWYRHGGTLSLDYGDDLERTALIVFPTPYDLVALRETKEQLYRAIAQLPEKQRSRICAYYFLDMTLKEIAESEGTKISTVQEGIQRGLRRLQKNLENFHKAP